MDTAIAHARRRPAADADASLAAVVVIIPALNEAATIGRVVRAIPAGVGGVIVVDNGSTDGTANVAREAGAMVVHEPRRGYGQACMAGLAGLRGAGGDVEVVAFCDADLADDPALLGDLVRPILADEADLVIGSRARDAEPGSLTLPQRLGNAIATAMIGILCRGRFTDLGPFRAVRRSSLERLAMDDRTYGWTVQMQVRAVRQRLRCREIAVPYRRRAGGASKISGTLRGLIGAGVRIPMTILREAVRPPRHLPPRGQAEQLITFARWPVPGQAKTRLIPALGAEGAADLQQRMTRHVLAQADRLSTTRPNLRHAIRVAQPDGVARSDVMRRICESFGPRRYLDQGDGDLGRRLHCAAAAAFAEGAQRVVLIGTDCPAITPAHLHAAFEALRESDVVIGPALDGGYYLLGLSRMTPSLFRGIDWGTSHVLQQTLAAAKAEALRVTQLEPLPDVDRPEDVAAGEAAMRPAGLAVIVPTLNEADHLPATLARLSDRADAATRIIVADGGSTDATVAIARQHGAEVVVTSPGRARQMNAGAAVAADAGAEMLLFCHADTLLPPDYPQQVRHALAHEDVVGGAFSLRLDEAGRGYRWVERAVGWRSRRRQLPYGDQGIFVRRRAWQAVGGFDASLTAMEDYALVQRLRRRGVLVTLDAPAVTSARYWRRHGLIGATLRNQLVIAAYHLGLPGAALAKLRRG